MLLLYGMEDVKSLTEKVTLLTELLSKALDRITYLEARLKKYEHPKNSKNSSVPPSKDENRVSKNQSLREKTDKKVGGQNGHEGHTLKMTATPDVVSVIKPNFCGKCGNDLAAVNGELTDTRQVIDIPPIKAITTEYRLFKKVCSCGHCNKPSFPDGVNAPIQYGKNIESMVAYLSVRQYLPFERMKELFDQVFQIPISKGTIQNILVRAAEKAMPIYQDIKSRIEQCAYVGGDETSVRVNGKKMWVWTIQNESFTFLHTSDNRGFATLRDLFPNGLPKTIIGHDAYPAWFKLDAKAHQLCLAHLHRDLNYYIEYYPKDNWAQSIKELLYEACENEKNQKQNIEYFKSKLDPLLQNAEIEKYSLLKPFVKRLQKHKDSLFLFVENDFVPPDNNGSERAIRNTKVKTKISGQFKSIENANIFAILRSVIDSLIKRNQPILENLNLLANFRPE